MIQIYKKTQLKIFYKPFVLLLAFLFLIQFTVFHSVASQVSINKELNEYSLAENSESYIIEFKDLSLLAFKSKLRTKLSKNAMSLNTLENQIKKHKSRLVSLHQRAKNDILNLLENRFSSRKIFSHDFTLLSNSIVVKNIGINIIEKIKSLSYVKNIRKDATISILSDTPLSWGVGKIRADEVWKLHDNQDRNITGEGISIAILDTGIDYHHHYFGGGFGPGYKVVDGYDHVRYNRYNPSNNTYWKYKEPDPNPDDENGHGTHCAGIALGVSPNASLYSYRVMNKDGYGRESWFLEGITRALDPNGDEDTSDHVDIISISAGNKEGNPNDNLSQAVDLAVDCGVIVLAAAGNNGPSEYTINSPACAEKAIAVGSTDINDYVVSTSSKGPTIFGKVKPDVVAPGRVIESTWLDNSTQILSGTSMATPHVAGATALVLQKHPDWTPEEVKMALRNTARKDLAVSYQVITQGYGRINALDAVLLDDKPPISKIDTSGIIFGLYVDIKGTASSDNFQNYSIYYKNNSQWIKLFEGENQVITDKLFTLDTNILKLDKKYLLKLVVNSDNQSSLDYVFIKIDELDEINIDCLDIIKEKQTFTVSIFDKNKEPINGFIIFTSPFHIPQIKYGSNAEFRGIRILNPFCSNVKGKIMFIKLINSRVITKEITIKNNNSFNH